MLAHVGACSAIGLLGGRFNPAHRGHRRISLAALDALGLDEVWWLVSPGNPLKPADGHGALRGAARLGAARWRGAAGSGSAISRREAGTRYTVDTLARCSRALARTTASSG